MLEKSDIIQMKSFIYYDTGGYSDSDTSNNLTFILLNIEVV